MTSVKHDGGLFLQQLAGSIAERYPGIVRRSAWPRAPRCWRLAAGALLYAGLVQLHVEFYPDLLSGGCRNLA